MTELVAWINQTAAILLGQVPLQSLDSAVALVEAYISDVGGWLPVIQQQPNGDGAPANGFTEQQSADAITVNEFNAIYDLNFTVDVTLDVQIIDKLSDGLDVSTAAVSMANQLTDFLTARINESSLPIRLNNVGVQTVISGRSDLGGNTTQAIRQTIAADLAGTDKLVDFKATTLLYARNTYGLDNTWNVRSVYTEPNEPIVVFIKKYTNTTYAALDGTSTRIYVFTISPATYTIVSGVILS